MELAEVYELYRSDPNFDHLRTPGIILVPGEGSPRPSIFIVGEAPGATENTAKRPFVGASGQVLRSCIVDVARLQPVDYFITNVVKYRPPGNRTPTDDEISDSIAHLRREYAAVGSPPVVVAVGGVAKRAIAPGVSGVLSNAGKPLPMARGNSALWIMIHPSYGLRNPKARPTMERHWEEFGEWFRREFS